MVRPLQCFDVRGFGRDEGEEVDDLCAVGIDDLDCLSLLERHGDSGTRGDEVFLAGWVGGGHVGEKYDVLLVSWWWKVCGNTYQPFESKAMSVEFLLLREGNAQKTTNKKHSVDFIPRPCSS